MTATLSIAAQIAQDIREAIKPDFVPASIDRRLEAIIDANLAGERAKVAKLIEALEAFTTLYAQGQLTIEGDNGNDPVITEARAALFNLQA